MRVLLDTNIVIHRENTKATNFSIGRLYYWLDELHYEKLIHPYTVKELRKLNNDTMQSLYDAKLSAYKVMQCVASQTHEFISLLNESPKTENDSIDNQLLYEIFCGRADLLITEDRRMHKKAERLGLLEKIFTIDSFISKATNEHPELLDYNFLSVKKVNFGNVNISNSFFDTFRKDYDKFDRWFASKCDEEAYICYNDQNAILGFLYLKPEDENENYSDITPVFSPKKRLKVGTFKVEATGFRLGERFIKIIFDNAIKQKLDEIYVTLFINRPELKALYDLLIKWGFCRYGTKTKDGKTEEVLVKKLGTYDKSKSVIWNFPNLNLTNPKMILPIFPKYHTPLFPDSQLRTENEVDFLENVAYRYALQKVYITWAPEKDVKPGDLLVFYRTGDTNPKKYSSVVTTIGVVDEYIDNFSNEAEFLKHCQNRSVFSIKELQEFWRKYRYNLKVVKFIYIKSLNKRLTLGYLWDNNIIKAPNGPRPFTRITDEQFNLILKDSETEL